MTEKQVKQNHTHETNPTNCNIFSQMALILIKTEAYESV